MRDSVALGKRMHERPKDPRYVQLWQDFVDQNNELVGTERMLEKCRELLSDSRNESGRLSDDLDIEREKNARLVARLAEHALIEQAQ